MQKNYTHITVVLDKSGSMGKIANDTIGGFNQFITDQKKVEGLATLSLIQFDDRYEPNYLSTKIQDVELLNEKTYKPRGWTRLFDAIGRAIIDTGEELNKLKDEEKPEKVVFVVQTDGEENSSKEFNAKEIGDLIKQQTDKYKWEFVFLGAQLNTILAMCRMGVSGANTMQYAHNTAGMKSAMKSLSSNLMSYRAGRADSMAWTDEDKKAQEVAGIYRAQAREINQIDKDVNLIPKIKLGSATTKWVNPIPVEAWTPKSKTESWLEKIKKMKWPTKNTGSK
jgi:hypothetical protein